MKIFMITISYSDLGSFIRSNFSLVNHLSHVDLGYLVKK